MVATRRTATTAADIEMADPELALKKKPVRKATAKAAAKTETATKAKATRGRKAEAAAVVEEAEIVEEAPKPRATRGRPKKTIETAAEPEPRPEVEEPAKPTKVTRATKEGSVRGRKAAVAVEEAPELPAPQDAKLARQTRAAASKAPPLSPKKITQVVKPATRNAKAAGQKPAGKAAATRGSVRSRAGIRGRQVSDENAEVPELTQPEVEEDSVMVVSSTPVKKPATRRQAAKKQEVDESEVSMSTQDTTLTASPAQSQKNDDGESEAEEPSAVLSTPEKHDQTLDNQDSDDELCGPKTPMRRGSPGAEARYHSSAQRTIRKYNEEQQIQTPARRYAVLGSQRGTPQTQKPYCKPAAPSSEVRPMTVSRGANRAFVFRDLRDGAPDLRQRLQQQQGAIVEEEDMSFIPDDNIIDMDDGEGAQLVTPSAPAPVQLASPPTSSTDTEDEEGDNQDELDSVESEQVEFGIPTIDNSDNIEVEDPDATIITEDHHDETELDVPAQQAEAESFETEDTVLICRPEQAEAGDITMSSVDDNSMESVIHHQAAASDTPETMVWENVQPEQTIAVNFDEHLNEARTLPEPEPTEVLNIASTMGAHLERNSDAVAGADDVFEQESEVEEAETEEEDESSEEAAPVTTPAVDLNDYFDMAALAEPTQAIDFALQPTNTVDTEMQDVQDVPASDYSAEDVALEQVAAQDEPAVPFSTESDVLDETLHLDDLQEREVNEQHDASAIEEGDSVVALVEPAEDVEVPHYARSTFAFDARRKSLPATSMFTPVRTGARPSTSDGASMPRVMVPFGQAWWTEARPSTAHGAPNTPSKATTPAAKERYPVFAPRQNQVDHSQSAAPARFRDASEKPSTRRQTFHRAVSGKTQKPPTPVKLSTPAAAATPVQKSKERYPALGSQSAYVDHSQTAAPPARFRDAAPKPADRRMTFHRATSGKTQAPPTPVKPSSPAKVATPVATPKERYPGLGSRTTYGDHAKTVAPPQRFQDPVNKPSNRRQTFHRALSGKAVEKEEEAATPTASTPIQEEATPKPQQTPTERFPRLRPRADYQDHAKTVAAPRFATPTKSPLRRPATTQKPTSMRKAALRNSASTPMKTPLKAPAMTLGQEPMTPHPAAPLRGVTALVEVYTLEGASASAPFTALLHRLGAKTARTWTDRVTHVIFKDGSPTTLQRVRLHNKDVDSSGKGTRICCVNSRWVSDCDTAGTREDENDEAYAIDVEEVPRGGKRRRKSMEPSALMNLGGNIVRDRKSSLGRSSLSRSSIQSPAKKAKIEMGGDATPGAEDKENSDDEEPATPAWIAEPDKLVQMTAPQKRVRKLDLQGSKSKRLSLWDVGN